MSATGAGACWAGGVGMSVGFRGCGAGCIDCAGTVVGAGRGVC